MSDSIQTIRVNTLPAYTVSIGSGLLSCCGPRLREIMPACHIAVITDTTVAPLYLDRVTDSLCAAGFTVSSFAFPAGEAHKTLATFSDILEFLAEHRLTRTDCVVALGGGVVDLPILGGTARIRHLGPEPIRSSRWAAISASRTK